MTLTNHRPWRSGLRRLRPATRRWLPPVVSLYWRRRRSNPAQGSARRSRPSVAGGTTQMTFVSIQQHFHRSAAVSRGDAFARQGAAPSSTGSAVLLTRLTHRLVEKRVATVAASNRSPVERTVTTARATRPAPARPEAPVARRGSRNSGAPRRPGAVPVVGRVFARTVPLRPAGGPATPPSNWPHKPRVAQGPEDPVAWRGRRVASAAAPAVAVHHATGERAPAVARASTRVRAASGVAMDWRAPQARAVSHPSAAAVAPAPAADRALPRVPPPPAQPDAPAQPDVRAPRDKAAPLALDPSTIDRLADNVMQRIDRRIRIERERRGL